MNELTFEEKIRAAVGGRSFVYEPVKDVFYPIDFQEADSYLALDFSFKNICYLRSAFDGRSIKLEESMDGRDILQIISYVKTSVTLLAKARNLAKKAKKNSARPARSSAKQAKSLITG